MSTPKNFIRTVDFLSTTDSTNLTTASIVSYGGLSIKKNVNFGQNLTISGNLTVGNILMNGYLYTSTGSQFSGSQWTTSGSSSIYYYNTTANSYVGINTTTPSFSLDITGDVRITGGTLFGSNQTFSNSVFTNLSSNNFIFTNQSGSTLNLSIGITTVSLLNTGLISSANLFSTTATIPNIVHTNITTNSLFVTASLIATFNCNTIGNLYTTAGNVGINTTAPSQTLDVNGISAFGTNTGNSKIYISKDEIKLNNIGITNYTIRNSTSGNLDFENSSSNTLPGTLGIKLLSITPSGNIGIGTTSPNAALQFANVTGNRKIVLYDSNNNDNQYNGFGLNSTELRYQVSNTSTDHVFYAGVNSTTSNELFRIKGTGNVIANTINASTISSSNINSSNLTTSNLSTTNISTLLLNSNSITTSNLISNNITSTNLITSNITTNTLLSNTSISTNNLLVINISSISINSTNSNFTNNTTQNAVVTSLTSLNSVITNLTTATLNVTGITNTNLYVTGIATIANLNITNSSTFPNVFATNVTSGSVLVISSSSLIGNSNTVGNIFTTGGNVGINTTAPNTTLYVNGNTYLNGAVTIGNYLWINNFTTGNIITNNINYGIANTFSGSFAAANNIPILTNVTGLSFPSSAIRFFKVDLSVSIITSTGGSYQVFTLEGSQNTSGWNLYQSNIGDTSGISISITLAGQVQYTSTNISGWLSNIMRFSVTQITNNGTYQSLLNPTVGNYIVNSLQLNTTDIAVAGINNGSLYTLGGATFGQNIQVYSTNDATAVGSGGCATILGGMAISKNLIIGGGISTGQIFSTGLTTGNINLTGSLYQNGTAYTGSQWLSGTGGNLSYTNGNVGINTTSPLFTLDVNGAIRGTNIISTTLNASIGISTGNILSTGITTGNINFTGSLYQNSTPYLGSQWSGTNGTSLYYGSTGSINVGIGTTNPTFTLDVNGTMRVATSITTELLNATNITSTNLASTNFNSTTNTLNNLTSINITTGSLFANTSISSASLFSTNSTTTNLVGINLSSSNLVATTATISNITLLNITTSSILAASSISSAALYVTNITSANIVSTNNTLSNLFNTNITTVSLLASSISAANLYSTNTTTVNLIAANITSNNLISTFTTLPNLFTTNITSSNLYSTNVNSTNISSLNITTASLITTSISASNVYSSNITSLNISGVNITTSNIYVTGNTTINNLYSNNLTVGNIVTGNVNYGIANTFSASFLASNNVGTATPIVGLLFASAAQVSFTANLSVSIIATTNSFAQYILEGIQTASGWNMSISNIGDITGMTFTINSTTGQVNYISSNTTGFISNTLRFIVSQISSTGTYTALLGNTTGSYILGSLQLNNTSGSTYALDVLGSARFLSGITGIPAFSINNYNSSSISYPTSLVTSGSVIIDNKSGFNPLTAKYTIPITGYYQVSLNSRSGDGSYAMAVVIVTTRSGSSTQTPDAFIPIDNSNRRFVSFSRIMQFNLGDTVFPSISAAGTFTFSFTDFSLSLINSN